MNGGRPVWKGSPGTPFTQLPDHWKCPECDGPRNQFMVVHDD